MNGVNGPPVLWPINTEIQKKFDLWCPRRLGTRSASAAKQAAVANALYAAVEGDLASDRPGTAFLFCPTEYCGRMAKPSLGFAAPLWMGGAEGGCVCGALFREVVRFCVARALFYIAVDIAVS